MFSEKIPGLGSLIEKISESISGEWDKFQGKARVDCPRAMVFNILEVSVEFILV